MLKKVLLISLLLSADCLASEDEQPLPPVDETMIIHPDPEDDWLFGFHNTISDSVFGSAKWFDSFFAIDELEETTPKTLARIRLGYEPRARDWQVFTQKFRLHLQLPNLENAVDIILSDEDDDDISNNQNNSGRALTGDQNQGSFTAAIRFINIDTLSEFVDSRIGISGGDLFAKVRAKIQTDFSERHLFKFQPSIFYYLNDGFGSRLFFEYDFNFAEQKQFRANYSIKTSESFKGTRWRNGYYYLNRIDRYRASALGVVIVGENNGDRGFVVNNYTLSWRYRINAYRRWLYFEVEPFVEWPEDVNYKTTPGIALRIEGYFQAN